ncbi:VOC family protein [Cohnella sp. REN36]|uniref:VOC family protein n=1 Tax=Cohnella sp. REN36 TaxID=2887347 RepID=UPI001D14EBF9|nr:VOC family protein [Cohnella sp. REN36]MCC3372626.1 VOC family protein [Cohnella sp. REN36]
MNAKLTPYIASQDARAQADFYIQALGGEILSLVTHGQNPGSPAEMSDKVMHMVLSVAGGNMLFLSDAFGPTGSEGSIAFGLTFGDVEAARQANANLGEGGTQKYPFEKQVWGAYYGEVVDKFGIRWQIAQQD